MVVPSLAPYRARRAGHRRRRGRAGQRARRRRTTSSTTTGRSPRTTSRPRVDLAAEVAAGSVPQPDFVLWPENSTAVDPFRDASDQRRHPARRRRDRRPDPGRRDRRRGRGPRPEPGDRVGPRDRRGGAVHQAPPGRLRRVHAVPPLLRSWGIEDKGQLGRISRDMLSGTSDAAAAGRRGRGGRRDLLRRGLRRRASTTRSSNGAELLAVQTSNASFIFTDQIDQQFAITRLRAIESGQVPGGRLHQRHHRRHRPRRQRGRVGRAAHPGGARGAGRAAAELTPAVRLGQWLAVLLPLLTAVGLVLRRGHVSSRAAHRRPSRRRPRPVLTGPDEKASRD